MPIIVVNKCYTKCFICKKWLSDRTINIKSIKHLRKGATIQTAHIECKELYDYFEKELEKQELDVEWETFKDK